MAPFLANLHVYHWLDTYERRPLAEGALPWLSYLRAATAATTATSGPRWALLEFVRDDDPTRLAEDAATLLRWIAQVDTDKGQA